MNKHIVKMIGCAQFVAESFFERDKGHFPNPGSGSRLWHLLQALLDAEAHIDDGAQAKARALSLGLEKAISQGKCPLPL